MGKGIAFIVLLALSLGHSGPFAASGPEDPPATFSECADCPPLIPYGGGGQFGFSLPPCGYYQPSYACYGGGGSPSVPEILQNLKAPSNQKKCCATWHIEPDGSIGASSSWEVPPDETCDPGQEVPCVDADGDGVNYLEDPDENHSPFAPNDPMSGFNDDDFDGMPNVLDLLPQGQPGTSSYESARQRGEATINPFGLGPQDWSDDADSFRNFLKALGFSDSAASQAGLPPDFQDSNGDGYLTLGEVLGQVVDFFQNTLLPDYDNYWNHMQGAAPDPAYLISVLNTIAGTANAIYKLVDGMDPEYFGGEDAAQKYKDQFHRLATQFGSLASEIEIALKDVQYPAQSEIGAGEVDRFGTAFVPDSSGTPQVHITYRLANGTIVDLTAFQNAMRNNGPNAQSQVGDPVDTSNGELVHRVTDLEVPGRGLDLKIERVYRSKSNHQLFSGFGWHLPLLETHMVVWTSANGKVLDLNWGDGSRSTFELVSSSDPNYPMWVGSKGEFGKIRYDVDIDTYGLEPGCTKRQPGYVLRRPDGTMYWFCPETWYFGLGSNLVCWLRKVSDPYGNTIVLKRDEFGRTKTIVDTLHRKYTLTWDENKNLLTKIQDPLGRTIDYTYELETSTDATKAGMSGGGGSSSSHHGAKSPTRVNKIGAGMSKFDLLRVDYPTTRYLDDAQTIAQGRPFEAYTYHTDPRGWESHPEPVLNHNLQTITRDSKGPAVSINYYEPADPYDYNYDRVSDQKMASATTRFQYEKIDTTNPDPYNPKVDHRTQVRFEDGEIEEYFHGESLLLRKATRNGRFDLAGNLISGSADPLGPDQWITVFDFNDDFQLVEQTQTTDVLYPVGGIAQGRKAQMTYDSSNPDRSQQGNLLHKTAIPYPASTTIPSQLDWSYELDPVTAQPIRSIDPLGREERRYFDHQERSYDQVRDALHIVGWGILGPTPLNPSAWDLGDLNGDGKIGGTFQPVKFVHPSVPVESPTGPGFTSYAQPQEKRRYNSLGQIVGLEDTGGMQTQIQYQCGVPTTIVVDSSGIASTTRISYDLLGRIIAKVLPDGVTKTFRYDGRSLPIETRLLPKGSAVPLTICPSSAGFHGGTHTSSQSSGSAIATAASQGATGSGAANAYVQQSFFDIAGRSVASRTAFFQQSSADTYAVGISPPWHRWTHYNAADQALQIDRSIRDPQGAIVPNGTGSWFFQYDGKGQSKSTTNPFGGVIQLSRDGRGLVIERLRKNTAGADFGKITTLYNDFGEAIESSGPEDSNGDGTPDTTKNILDGYGRLNTVVSPTGVQSIRSLDAVGRVLSNEIRTGQNVLLSQDTFQYDAWDRLLRQTSLNLKLKSDGSVVALDPPTREVNHGFGLRAEEKLWSLVDPAGTPRLTRFTYDSAGRQTGIYHGATNFLGSSVVLDAAGNVMEEESLLDDLGNSSSVNPSKRHTTRTYNSYGQLEKIFLPGGGYSLLAYDSQGLVRLAVDPLNSRQFFEYDSTGRLLNEREKGFDGIERISRYEYDIENRPTKLIDAKGQQTEYIYDEFGRPKIRRFQDGKEIGYGFDRADRLIGTQNQDVFVSLDYDAENRVRTLSATGASANVIRTFDYDGLGHTTRLVERVGAGPSVKTTRGYSSSGELLEEALQIGNGPIRSFQISYDGTGAIGSLQYPSGFSVSQHFDAVGRLNRIATGAGADLLVYTDPYGSAHRTAQIPAGGASIENDFDAAGRILRKESKDALGSVLAGSSYTYDKAGNLKTRTRSLDGLREEFEYDGFHRLRQWKRDVNGTGQAVRQVDWQHDLVDNVVGKTDTANPSVTGTPNNLNQIVSLAPIFSQITYTTRGQESSRSWGTQGQMVWSWDALGRPVSTVTSDASASTTVSWLHDGFNRLVTKTDSQGGSIRYGYVGASILERDAGSGDFQEFVLGANGMPAWRLQNGSQGHFFHLNPFGNVESLFTATAASESYDYEPYGKPLDLSGSPIQASSLHNDLFFQAQPYDFGTGLSRLGARHYDPKLETFVSRDPLGEAGSRNLYSYALRNPFRFHDRTGLSPQENQSPHAPAGPFDPWHHDEKWICAGSLWGMLDRVVAMNYDAFGLESPTTFDKLPTHLQVELIADLIESTDKLLHDPAELIPSAERTALWNGRNAMGELSGWWHLQNTGLDVFQSLLDSAGPPGALTNAGISYARDDDFGAAATLVGMIPLAGVVKTIFKNLDWVPGFNGVRRTTGNLIRFAKHYVNQQHVGKPGGQVNCFGCAVATDATLAGRPASALPSMEPWGDWRRAEEILGGKLERVTGEAEIAWNIYQSGNGARGVVVVNLKGIEGGHAFNVINDHGQVRFINSQNPAFDPEQYFKAADAIWFVQTAQGN